jgi:serine/threonine-protein kinase RIO1
MKALNGNKKQIDEFEKSVSDCHSILMRYDEVISTKAQKVAIDLLRAEMFEELKGIINVGTDAEVHNRESKSLMVIVYDTQRQYKEAMDNMALR